MNACSPDAVSPVVSVVIPNYNGARWLGPCLEGLAKQNFRDFEVILVDNGSTDDSVELALKHCVGLRLIALDTNSGFAAAVNKGIRAARGVCIALLNNDTAVKPGWLGALVRTLGESPADVVAVASKMLLADAPHLVDDAGDALSWTGAAEKIGHRQPASRFADRREILSTCAGATLYRRTFLEEVGGFDEAFFAYLEDVDLGLRGRLRGYRYLFEPEAEVLHKGHGSAIPGTDYVRLVTQNRLMLFAKNVPMFLLLKHAPQLLYGQIYFAIVYRKPWHSLAGYVAFVKRLPYILQERRRIARSRRISVVDFEKLLSMQMSEPPLRKLLGRRLRRLLS